MTKEILSYIKALDRLNRPATIPEMKMKFPNQNINSIVNELLGKGEIFEPLPGIFRSLE